MRASRVTTGNGLTRGDGMARFALLLWCLWWLFPGVSAAATDVPRPGVVAPAQGSGETLGDTFDSDLDFSLDEGSAPVVADPIEGWNRLMFRFNDRLYFWVLKPVARVFRVVPEPIRSSFGNFFSNVATPVRFVNALLQARFKDAGRELTRFVINTTVGIAGFFDPAKKYGHLDKKEEDFGQTLGRYGIGPGPYLVIPLLGPANARDVVGRVADFFLDPFYYLVGVDQLAAIDGFDTVNDTSLDDDTYEKTKRDALDPYLFIRDAYSQHRAAAVRE